MRGCRSVCIPHGPAQRERTDVTQRRARKYADANERDDSQGQKTLRTKLDGPLVRPRPPELVRVRDDVVEEVVPRLPRRERLPPLLRLLRVDAAPAQVRRERETKPPSAPRALY